MARRPGELENRRLVAGKTEPVEAVENGGDRRIGRALAVGILDAQQETAAVPARIEPVEQCGSRSADMQEAGRRWGKAGDDGLGHGRKSRW